MKMTKCGQEEAKNFLGAPWCGAAEKHVQGGAHPVGTGRTP